MSESQPSLNSIIRRVRRMDTALLGTALASAGLAAALLWGSWFISDDEESSPTQNGQIVSTLRQPASLAPNPTATLTPTFTASPSPTITPSSAADELVPAFEVSPTFEASPTPQDTATPQIIIITATPQDTVTPAPSPTPQVIIITATPLPISPSPIAPAADQIQPQASATPQVIIITATLEFTSTPLAASPTAQVFVITATALPFSPTPQVIVVTATPDTSATAPADQGALEPSITPPAIVTDELSATPELIITEPAQATATTIPLQLDSEASATPLAIFTATPIAQASATTIPLQLDAEASATPLASFTASPIAQASATTIPLTPFSDTNILPTMATATDENGTLQNDDAATALSPTLTTTPRPTLTTIPLSSSNTESNLEIASQNTVQPTRAEIALGGNIIAPETGGRIQEADPIAQNTYMALIALLFTSLGFVLLLAGRLLYLKARHS